MSMAARYLYTVVPISVLLMGTAAYLAVAGEGSSENSMAKETPVQTHISGSAQSLDSVANLLAGLQQRLESHPDDINGWVLLARSYQHLQQLPDAIQAMKHARMLGYDGPDYGISAAPITVGELGRPANSLHPSVIDAINKSQAADLDNAGGNQ